MKTCRVLVIGGGASGLAASIHAARSGADVTILEHNDRVGKKILSTGNGKCNLTNLHMNADCFRGADPRFIKTVLERFTVQDTLDFFGELGIYPKIKNGYVYPNSEQAASVLDVLRQEAEFLKVRVITEAHAAHIRPQGGNKGFVTEYSGGRQESDAVIVAAGSKAAPVTGSDGSGYELAKELGHKIIRPLPALVQLRSDKNPVFKQLAGIRTDALVSIESEGHQLAYDRGEVQLTDYGISGIPVFQVSRFASNALAAKKTVTALLDFLPDLELCQVQELLESRKALRPQKACEDYLTGLFPKKLAHVLLKQAGIPLAAQAGSLSFGRLSALAGQIKRFSVPITASNPFPNAQVCCGGVDTAQICPETMESRLVKGLYFAGEIMDVDGICGGYNLQWAWSTAAIAGRSGAETGARKDKERK